MFERMPPRLRSALLISLGIAVTALAGYLVAALLFFPAPLLPSERVVSLVVGMREQEARADLERGGLTAQMEEPAPHPSAAVGTVIWQDPPPGVAVPRGTAVSLVLSSGEPTVVVPDVHGFDADIAQRILSAAGLHVDGLDSVDVKEVPSGMATGTTPIAGDRMRVGRSLTLHLAR